LTRVILFIDSSHLVLTQVILFIASSHFAAKYYNYHGSVDTSTTNTPTENRTKGDDSLRRNLPSANGIKKLNFGFASLAVK